MIAIKAMIGSARIPVSSMWREIDGRRSARQWVSAVPIALVARPMKTRMSYMSCHASSAPFPSSITSRRQCGTRSGLGSAALRSSPPTRSSSARCSARTPVKVIPSSRSAHRNSAPGVSRSVRPLKSSVRDLPLGGCCFSEASKSGRVRIPRAPFTATRAPASSMAMAGGGDAGDARGMAAASEEGQPDRRSVGTLRHWNYRANRVP